MNRPMLESGIWAMSICLRSPFPSHHYSLTSQVGPLELVLTFLIRSFDHSTYGRIQDRRDCCDRTTDSLCTGKAITVRRCFHISVAFFYITEALSDLLVYSISATHHRVGARIYRDFQLISGLSYCQSSIPNHPLENCSVTYPAMVVPALPTCLQHHSPYQATSKGLISQSTRPTSLLCPDRQQQDQKRHREAGVSD